MMGLCGIQPLFINAGLRHTPTVPCLDVYGMQVKIPGTVMQFPWLMILY